MLFPSTDFFAQLSYQGETFPIYVPESLPFGTDTLETQLQVPPDEWLQSAHMPSLLDKQDKSKEPGLPASGQNGSESGTTKNDGAEVGSVCPN